MRWQVHWRGQAREIRVGGLDFLVEGAKGRWLLAQRKLLFLYTQDDEFRLSPGGWAQGRRILDDAKLVGCHHQTHMRVSTLSAQIPRLPHLRVIPSYDLESVQR